MPMFKYQGGGEGDVFMKRCPDLLTKTQIECAMKATDLPSLDKCVDREALDDKLGG